MSEQPSQVAGRGTIATATSGVARTRLTYERVSHEPLDDLAAYTRALVEPLHARLESRAERIGHVEE
jgi:hypothetical protein